LGFCLRLSRCRFAPTETFFDNSQPRSQIATLTPSAEQLLAERRFAHRKSATRYAPAARSSAMKNNIVRLLLMGDGDQQRRLLERLVLHLASAVDAVRANRSFHRRNPGKLKPGFHPAYKRAA
jgi:hypothetical protein